MLTYDNSVSFTEGREPPVSLQNFYPPEDGFIWSSGRWSQISFEFAATAGRAKKSADVILDFDVFKMEGHLDGQNVLIYLNGLRVGSHYIMRRATIVISIDATLLKPSENILIFDTPESRKPADFGLADDRQLGIQLFSIRIRPAG